MSVEGKMINKVTPLTRHAVALFGRVYASVCVISIALVSGIYILLTCHNSLPFPFPSSSAPLRGFFKLSAMQFVWFSIAFLFVLAGRGMAKPLILINQLAKPPVVLATFNITLGNNVLLPADFLNIPSQSVPSEVSATYSSMKRRSYVI